jgi:hypothetical protein
MGYVSSVIQPGEKVIFDGKIHWIVYAAPIVLMLIGTDIMFLGPEQASQIMKQEINKDPPFFLIGGGCLLVLGLVNLLSAIFYRLTTEIAVTNRRVIFKKGFVWRKTMEMNVNKVESVYINQTVLGRLLDYGTVAVVGTGSSIEPFTSVDSPIKLRNTIQTFDP